MANFFTNPKKKKRRLNPDFSEKEPLLWLWIPLATIAFIILFWILFVLLPVAFGY